MTDNLAPNHANHLDALDAFRVDVGSIPKRGYNPHFSSHFADYEDIRDAVDPNLPVHGLAVTQTMTDLSGRPALRTALYFNGSVAEEGTVPLPGDTAQAVSASNTYMRRIALVTILGLRTDDDTDGAAGGQQQARQQQQQRPQAQQPQQGGTASRVAAAAGRTQPAPAAPSTQQPPYQGTVHHPKQDTGEMVNERQGKNLYRLFKKAESDLGWDRDRYTQQIALFGDGVTDDRQLTKDQATALISDMKLTLGEEDQQQAPRQQQAPQNEYAYDDNGPF